MENAANTLDSLGGNPLVTKEAGKFIISSSSCPLATVVTEHPETCQMVETLVSEMTGAEARELCDRQNTPRCRFAINETD